MTKDQICSSIILAIKDYLSTPSRLDAFKAPGRFVRKRLLSMLHVIIYLFFSDNPSMDTNLANIKRELYGLVDFPQKITKQAVSHARQAINPMLFAELFNLSVDIFYQNTPKRNTWNGLHVFAIDGSKFELPNSKKNFDHFGEMFKVSNPDSKFTQALASVVYDVLDDYIVHASIKRYLASERDSALLHLKTLEDLGIYENSVIVFDRGYYSEAMFRYCVSHGHLCVMRLKDSMKFCKEIGKKVSDSVRTLHGNPKAGTEDIPVRIISVKLDFTDWEYIDSIVPPLPTAEVDLTNGMDYSGRDLVASVTKLVRIEDGKHVVLKDRKLDPHEGAGVFGSLEYADAVITFSMPVISEIEVLIENWDCTSSETLVFDAAESISFAVPDYSAHYTITTTFQGSNGIYETTFTFNVGSIDAME